MCQGAAYASCHMGKPPPGSPAGAADAWGSRSLGQGTAYCSSVAWPQKRSCARAGLGLLMVAERLVGPQRVCALMGATVGMNEGVPVPVTLAAGEQVGVSQTEVRNATASGLTAGPVTVALPEVVTVVV